MKLVLNTWFGNFNVKKSIAEKYGLDPYAVERDNPTLIKLIESGVNCNGEDADLEIIEIPDEVTDYEINEEDGFEGIIYVLDGKIHRI